MKKTLCSLVVFGLIALLMAAGCGGGGGGGVLLLPNQNPTYTVTYNGNGNTGGTVPVDSTNYEQGQIVTVLGNTGNLVKSGYIFSGWNTQADGNGTTYAQAQTFAMGSANVTLYAKWTANPTYTVTYDGNGNTGGSVPVDSTNYEQGQTVTVLGNTGNLVKSGYTFSGWNTAANGSGTNYAASGAATFTMGSANVTLYAKWTAYIKLPQTGQTTSYDANAVKADDGALQKGVAWPSPRFTDNADGTATDNLTGLMWLKYANCIKTQYSSFDADGTVGDGVVTWQHALDFVAGINAGTYPNCGGGKTGWRLPNVNDLESLVHAEYTKETTCGGACGTNAAWLNTQGFTDVETNEYYWSSTTLVAFTASAWFVGMFDGGVGASSKNGYLSYVWPVRDAAITATIALPKTGQTISYDANTVKADDGALRKGVAWPTPRFTDNADGTVTDNLTGLMWLKDANCAYTISYNPDIWGNGCVTWQHALDFVAGINSGTYSNCQGGHADWRLPNTKELRSLVDYSKWSPALPAGHPFTNAQADYYWSSTTNTYPAFTDNAWGVRLDIGDVSCHGKTVNCSYVWPVRGGQ